jgi:hypothetical protein
VIPADHKWFRNLAVSQIMADAMADLELSFPALGRPGHDSAQVSRRAQAGERRKKEGVTMQTAPFP